MFSEVEFFQKYELIQSGDIHLEKKMDIANFLMVFDLKNGNIFSKIIDLDFDDEYTNHKRDNVEGFPSLVLTEYLEFLTDIRNKYFKEKTYRFAQTNRIASLILEKYGDKPIFKWTDNTFSVFENKDTHKWYGLMGFINATKITGENKNIEVLNIKLDKNEIVELVNQKGFYPAYHMNKKSWITIILDDTLDDDTIMFYLNKSYQFAVPTSNLANNIWIAPSNPKMFDVKTIIETNNPFWKPIKGINKGDILYIYIAQPVGSIKYKCEVTNPNDNKMRYNKRGWLALKLLEIYPDGLINFDVLKRCGITAVRGARRGNKELQEEIDKLYK